MQRVNPINEAINTFAAVDNIYRGRRQDEERAEDRRLFRERQAVIDERQGEIFDRQKKQWADEDERGQLNARMFDLEERKARLAQKIGPDAAAYLDPQKRAVDKQYLTEGVSRLKSGNLDQDFFLDYTNTVYGRQIGRGTGGVQKRLSRIGVADDGQSLMAGLDVTREDGTVAKKMMTANRGTIEEGDTEPKRIRVQDLVADNMKRRLIIDEFDKAGVGGGEDDEAAIEAALAEVERKLIVLGDPEAIKRMERGRKAKRLQAVMAEVPENATPEEQQRAIYLAAAREGIDSDEVSAIVGTYKEKEAVKYQTFDDAEGRVYAYNPENPEDKRLLSGATKPTAAAGGRGGLNSDLTDSEKLVAQETFKRFNDFTKKAVDLRAMVGQTRTVNDEFGGTSTTTVKQGDDKVYEEAALKEYQTLIDMGVIKKPRELPDIKEYVGRAKAFLQKNPGKEKELMAQMEQDYPGSSKMLSVGISESFIPGISALPPGGGAPSAAAIPGASEDSRLRELGRLKGLADDIAKTASVNRVRFEQYRPEDIEKMRQMKLLPDSVLQRYDSYLAVNEREKSFRGGINVLGGF